MGQAGRTLIILATYNELENLPALVDEIEHYAPDADVLVIDDNSPDGTGAWCDARAATDPRVRCLHRPRKLGLGTALVAGMQYAIEHQYVFALSLDADFSHHPKYIPSLRAAMDGPQTPVDVMIGSRYVPGGGTRGWPRYRKWMGWAANCYARSLLGLTPSDCSGAFRCMRVETLKKLDLDSIISRGYAFPEEILWRLQRIGSRFGEFPIIFTNRQQGSSKITFGEIGAAAWTVFRLGITNWFRI
jgi:dolichol-phosphate mannosyltransferase